MRWLALPSTASWHRQARDVFEVLLACGGLVVDYLVLARRRSCEPAAPVSAGTARKACVDMALDGKRALVTGSSAGIGASITHRLADEGVIVVVQGRRSEPAHQVARKIRDRGGRAEVAFGDLAVPGEARELVTGVLAAGPIDVLVASAGPFSEHRFLEASDQDRTSAFTANVLTAVGCARAVVPGMRQRGWGRVITIATRAVATPLANMVAYSAAKTALVNATGALAQELAGTGITANVVSPGVILTPGLRTMFTERAAAAGDERGWEELEAEVTTSYAPNPVGRLGRPDDIAAAAVFLASPLADYITGAVLRVDGGITATINP